MHVLLSAMSYILLAANVMCANQCVAVTATAAAAAAGIRTRVTSFSSMPAFEFFSISRVPAFEFFFNSNHYKA